MSISASTLLDNLNWRYATKQFDPTQKLTSEQLDVLKESLRLAPSSTGLQPWKFVVVKDAKLRTQLREVSYDQPQITDASELFVLCARTDVDETYMESWVQKIADTRDQDRSELDGYYQMVEGTKTMRTPEQFAEWIDKQVYLALGFLLSTAAQLRIDACPMEGFDGDKYNSILGLDQEQLRAVVLAPVGYRSQQDKYAHAAKVRWSSNELFIAK